MSRELCTKLDVSVNIGEVRDYYNTVESDFSEFKWSWDQSDTIVKQWVDAAHTDPANLLTYGFAIQSNLLDLSLPCPPWNISTLPTTEYRNTVLAFGIIKRLQKLIPYGYRWAISIQPPGGKVGLHSDQEDELTVWMPIYTKGPAITFVINDKEIPIELESDGSLYLFDTTVPHYTFNYSDENRVAVIFRINEKYQQDILQTTGKV